MVSGFFFSAMVLFLRALACLPLGALYLLSDFVFFVMYYLLRYRRKVVDDNLAECFPDKDSAWRKKVAREFYRNFSDYVFETVKLLHISDREIMKRMEFENVGLMDSLVDQGKSVVVFFSHCFNWEWAPSVTLHFRKREGDEPAIVPGEVYRPLKNKRFDALMLELRGRFGSKCFAKNTVLRDLVRLRKDGIPSVTGFMSDQKPSHGDPTFVTMFLNRPTALITGTETLARKLGMAAVYWDMYKTGRGHYKIVCRELSSDVAATPQMTVTEAYARMLETTIRRNPAIWLWSHKRWKIPVELPKSL